MSHTLTTTLAYAGMTVILLAFLLETRGRLSSRGATYLWLMAIGSALLTVRAVHAREWAFAVLDGVWCAVALWALAVPRRPRRDARESRWTSGT